MKLRNLFFRKPPELPRKIQLPDDQAFRDAWKKLGASDNLMALAETGEEKALRKILTSLNEPTIVRKRLDYHDVVRAELTKLLKD